MGETRLEASLLTIALFGSLGILLGIAYLLGVPIARRWLRSALVTEKQVHLWVHGDGPSLAPKLYLRRPSRTLVFAKRARGVPTEELPTLARVIERAVPQAAWVWPQVVDCLWRARREARRSARAHSTHLHFLSGVLEAQKSATFAEAVASGVSTPEVKTMLAGVSTPEHLDALRRRIDELREEKAGALGTTPAASEGSSHA